jgi:Domain of unknown function (DUF1818)
MQVLEGEGWRLLVDPVRHPFSVLIGGDSWAAEFSWAEAAELRQLAGELERQLVAIADQLMPEESIALELERDLNPGSLWMELEGDSQSWSLRFVLTPELGRRGLEAGWGPDASAAICAALQGLAINAGP